MIPGRSHGISLFESFACAARGVLESAKGRNFRIQTAVGALAIALGAIFRIQAGEWLAVIICIGIVLAGECFNTAIESTVDLTTSEYRPLAKMGKDAAAGAVLIASIVSLAVGAIIFLPRLLALI